MMKMIIVLVIINIMIMVRISTSKAYNHTLPFIEDFWESTSF